MTFILSIILVKLVIIYTTLFCDWQFTSIYTNTGNLKKKRTNSKVNLTWDRTITEELCVLFQIKVFKFFWKGKFDGSNSLRPWTQFSRGFQYQQIRPYFFVQKCAIFMKIYVIWFQFKIFIEKILWNHLWKFWKSVVGAMAWYA